MGDKTAIEWTDATWNPVTGCDEVSPGCDHCYAKTLAERFRGTEGHYYEQGFDVMLRPDKLDQPMRWSRPRRVFVNSMSDLFHKNVPDEYIARVFAVMGLASQHTFQLLTKRHGRMRSLLSSDAFKVAVCDAAWELSPGPWVSRWPLPNVWLGVSVEDQKRADLRIPALLATPAAVRFLSCEPLLGPVDLGFTRKVNECTCAGTAPGYPQHEMSCGWEPANEGIDWVIAGGESGRGARPMHPDWVRSLRDQCLNANRAFLFKQWGDWVPEGMWLHRDTAPAAFIGPDGDYRPVVDGKPETAPFARGAAMTVRRVGKKAAGRVLDGATHDGYPDGTETTR